ncbi:MAG: helix-turn-helix transcriptional regulator [Phycisphaerae bacterium]
MDGRMSETKRRLLERLKTAGPANAATLAGELGLTDVAVRQHLLGLEERGLVCQASARPAGRGRPSLIWSLSESAAAVFPERHAELTVGLIQAARQAFGEKGLDRLVQIRAAKQVTEYRQVMPSPRASLRKRVESLAQRRTAEGYMAQVVRERPGCYLLIEHHCPICEAAKACTGLCGAELEVFRQCLGPDVEVERVEHLLCDGDRCVYRVRRRGN